MNELVCFCALKRTREKTLRDIKNCLNAEQVSRKIQCNCKKEKSRWKVKDLFGMFINISQYVENINKQRNLQTEKERQRRSHVQN